MLAELVALGDIDDVWNFVAGTLNRFERDAGITLEKDERDELQLEGICILFELAGRFEPHRPGYAQAGRFSGYAAMFLPRRLGDAWHRSHPEHKYVTDPQTGKRRWEYLKGTVSLDQQIQRGGSGTNRGGPGELDERAFLPAAQWTAVPAAAKAA